MLILLFLYGCLKPKIASWWLLGWSQLPGGQKQGFNLGTNLDDAAQGGARPQHIVCLCQMCVHKSQIPLLGLFWRAVYASAKCTFININSSATKAALVLLWIGCKSIRQELQEKWVKAMKLKRCSRLTVIKRPACSVLSRSLSSLSVED